VALRQPGAAAADELLGHCRSSLAKYKVPRDIFILGSLPKNPLGKIVKPPLRDRLQAS
jgi:acyl-CoA synthetase (AMP-forming)/AMP-acid ligase II